MTTLTYAVSRQPEHGTTRVDGYYIHYTATAGYTGPDDLEITVTDGRGRAAAGDCERDRDSAERIAETRQVAEIVERSQASKRVRCWLARRDRSPLRSHGHVVAAELIVMPRFCSSGSKSIVAVPSCTSPILWIFPE